MKPRPPLHWLIAASLALPAVGHAPAAKAAVPARQAGKGVSRVAEQTQTDRLALVIGNKDYVKAPLENPINDARDMKAALEQVGFRVIYRENASKLKMVEAVREFKSGLGPDSVGVVYFSGHGAQADGENYLIPVGADIRSKAELQEFAYNARIILGEMEDAGNRVNILILDACRDNPFKGFRGGADGLAMMSGPKGSLIAYATAPGSVAADGASGNRCNGVYTGYLKQYLTQPGLTVEQLFKKVRESVIAQNPEQVPWENSSITGEFCFAGCEGGAVPVAVPPEPPAAPAPNPQQQEVEFWNDIKASTDPADFEAYLKKYPEGEYADLARNKFRRLSQVANIPQESPRPSEQLISGRYRDNGDGTVMDVKTGLQWMRCDLGQIWNQGSCLGEFQKLTFRGAAKAAANLNRLGGYAGYRDWRVPTKEELVSVVKEGSSPAIDKVAFPDTQGSGHWSSSPYAYGINQAWMVYFGYDADGYDYSYNNYAVRLVRGGR